MRRIYNNLGPESIADKEEIRSRLDLIESRLDLLQERDKAIMELFLTYGSQFRRISLLTGLHEATIARRIRELSHALLNGAYINCVRTSNLSETELSIIHDHFLGGATFMELVERYGVTLHKVRVLVRHIKKSHPRSKTFRRTGGIHAGVYR